MIKVFIMEIPIPGKTVVIWVRSRNWDCLVTWFCYQLIAKPGNKTATVSWPDPYWDGAQVSCMVFDCPSYCCSSGCSKGTVGLWTGLPWILWVWRNSHGGRRRWRQLTWQHIRQLHDTEPWTLTWTGFTDGPKCLRNIKSIWIDLCLTWNKKWNNIDVMQMNIFLWLSVSLQFLHDISDGDTAVLHSAVDMLWHRFCQAI